MTLTISPDASLPIITTTEPITGLTTTRVPGLGYWLSEADAHAAVAKVRAGICPMAHTIEQGFAPRACPICGTVETVA
jgi:hypothetical protein